MLTATPSTTKLCGGCAEYVSELGIACDAPISSFCLCVETTPHFPSVKFVSSLVDSGFAWRDSEWGFLNPQSLYPVTVKHVKWKGGWVGAHFELNCTIVCKLNCVSSYKDLFLSALAHGFITTTNHIPFSMPRAVGNVSMCTPPTNIPRRLLVC